MAVKGGAGASVSSGANYQARVSAYFIASAICDAPIEDIPISSLISVGFETTEPTDDLNLVFPTVSCFLQIKRKLSFSTSIESDLFSALEQFARQVGKSVAKTDCILVTTSESSRKVTVGMRAAVNAFRLSDETAFRRDQPVEIVSIVDALLDALVSMSALASPSEKMLFAKRVLKSIHVLVLDIDQASSLEHAVLILLGARGVKLVQQVWQKIILDCLDHAAQRHTVNIEYLRERYAKFKSSNASTVPLTDMEDFFIYTQEGSIPCGKEIILGELLDEDGGRIGTSDVYVMEFARFNNDCQERLVFQDGICKVANGMSIRLIRRCATFAALTRYVELNPMLLADKNILIVESKLKQDLDDSLCAVQHGERLITGFRSQRNKLLCLHCGRAVSSEKAELIETFIGGKPEMGFSHPICTQSDDRVLGGIRSSFFQDFDFLINFDASQWFRKIQRGARFFLVEQPA